MERYESNHAKVEAIKTAIKAKKRIILRTSARAILLNKPEHIRVNKSGDVFIPRGRHWDFIFDGQVDALFAQTRGIKAALETSRMLVNA